MGRTILTAIVASAAALASADFSYSDFSDVSDFQLNGTAQQVGNLVRMTEDQINGQAGNMWHTTSQSVGLGFSTTFQFRCDGVGTVPADGMAFGIQANGTGVLGDSGDANAMSRLPGSVVVNFQSFWNKIQFVATDSSGNQVDFQEVDFSGLHRADPWTAQVTYDATTHDWDVYLDGNFILNHGLDISSAVGLIGGTDAYVGLGAGTGAGFDNNDALSWDMHVVPEPTTMSVFGLVALALARKRTKS